MKKTAVPTFRSGRPRTTAYKAVKLLTKHYYIDTKTGRVYNRHGVEVGSGTKETKITIHLPDGRKYGIRANKAVAFCTEGSEALRRGVSVLHVNGDRWDNRRTNLQLKYSKTALRNFKRLQAA